jgi:polyhydroxyalkanoate synthesis regulator phasin
VLAGTDDEVRRAAKTLAEQREKAKPQGEGKRPARRNVSIAEHEELQRKYDLAQVELTQLRERVAELRQALDALTPRRAG